MGMEPVRGPSTETAPPPACGATPPTVREMMRAASTEALARWILKNLDWSGGNSDENGGFLATILEEHARQSRRSAVTTDVESQPLNVPVAQPGSAHQQGRGSKVAPSGQPQVVEVAGSNPARDSTSSLVSTGAKPSSDYDEFTIWLRETHPGCRDAYTFMSMQAAWDAGRRSGLTVSATTGVESATPVAAKPYRCGSFQCNYPNCGCDSGGDR